jgi:hypothetical protein
VANALSSTSFASASFCSAFAAMSLPDAALPSSSGASTGCRFRRVNFVA